MSAVVNLCDDVSLLVSEEKLDDGIGFEIDLVHVGVLVLHHLMDKQTEGLAKVRPRLHQHKVCSHVAAMNKRAVFSLAPPTVQNVNKTQFQFLRGEATRTFKMTFV